MSRRHKSAKAFLMTALLSVPFAVNQLLPDKSLSKAKANSSIKARKPVADELNVSSLKSPTVPLSSRLSMMMVSSPSPALIVGSGLRLRLP